MTSEDLFKACARNEPEEVAKLLLIPKINVNHVGNCLTIVAFNGFTDCIKLLLKQEGLKVNRPDGETALEKACRKGHLECVIELLKVPEIEVNEGKTPIYQACYYGHIEIVKELLFHPKIETSKKERFDPMGDAETLDIKKLLRGFKRMKGTYEENRTN